LCFDVCMMPACEGCVKRLAENNLLLVWLRQSLVERSRRAVAT